MTTRHDNRSPQDARTIFNANLTAAAIVAAVAVSSRLAALGSWFNQDDWGLLARAAGLIPGPDLPVRWLSQDLYWTILWPLAGLDPAPYAVSRLVLHALTAAGVVLVAARLDLTRVQIWVAGLVMAASPLAFTALYWAAGVQDLLALCLAVWAIERWLCGSPRAALAATILGLGALAAKETVVGLPLLMAWLNWWQPAWRGDRNRWLLVAALAACSALAAIAALNAFDTGADQPYAVGGLTNVLANLVAYGWWLILPGPVFHPSPTLIMAAAGGLLWVVWAAWSRWQWNRRNQAPAFTLLGALVMLAPILPLVRHVAPDLAFPVEPFGCLALACLVPRRWSARPIVIAALIAGAMAWGLLGMRGRLQLRDAIGLPADPTVRLTAVSWEACKHLRQLPLDGKSLVIVQPPMLPQTAVMADQLGEEWVAGSPIYHALGGNLGPRLIVGPDVPVTWTNGLRRTPADAFVLLDAGATLKPWGPTPQALMNAVLTDVGLGHFERARLHLLRGSLLVGDTISVVFDPSVLPVTMDQVLANQEAFDAYLVSGRELGRTSLEIDGMRTNFLNLLSACTGRDIEDLRIPSPPDAAPGNREDQ